MSCLEWFLSWYHTLLLFLSFVAPILGEDSKIIGGSMHTIVSVECTPFFAFQTLGLFYSFKRVGMSGPFTRIMACSPEQREKYSQEDMELMNTHITPQFSHDDILDDEYSPYNKPMGIMHWMEHTKPREEWVLFVDPDMFFRHPVLPSQLRVPQGWAIASHFVMLKGTSSELADKYIPDVEKRKDNYGGDVGRRADEVGTFCFLRMEDMKRVAPLYMNFTRNVRADVDAFTLSHTNRGVVGKPIWISEMYGWVFAMAKNNIWHLAEPTLQSTPSLYVHDVPSIVHYTRKHLVANYRFNKLGHKEFDISKCPPWNLQTNRRQEEDGGLFPHPPFPREVGVDPIYENKTSSTGRRYGKLLIIETVNTLNEALCERHYRKCPMSRELLTECGKVQKIRDELDTEFAILDKTVCFDTDSGMCLWSRIVGQCKRKWLDMHYSCRKSCGFCSDKSWCRKGHRSVVCQLASLPWHIMSALPRFLRMTHQEISGRSSTKLMSLEIRCQKRAAGKVTGDLECARWWSLHRGLTHIDIAPTKVEEDGFSTDAMASLVILNNIITVVGCCFLAMLCSRRRSWWHWLT